jgi:D-alanyl-D-alanine carboxypeptidase
MKIYKLLIAVIAAVFIFSGCSENKEILKTIKTIDKAVTETNKNIAESKPVKSTIQQSENARTADAGTKENTTEQKDTPENSAQADDWKLILINSDNPLPDDFSVRLKTVQDNQVDARIAKSLSSMISDAKKQGVSLLICSGYRSVSKQKTLYENKVIVYEDQGYTSTSAQALAATVVARPGTSEHHTGLAVDFYTNSHKTLDSGFENTKAFHWLSANAYKYGFIMRYPEDKSDITKIIYEPWHYRYVGVENAERINELGICLEEYIDLLRNNT